MPTPEEENVELRERVASLEEELVVLRYFTGKTNVKTMGERADKVQSEPSPPVGTRVQIVNQGSRYNSKDFEKAGTFKTFKGEWVESVSNGDFGVVVEKASHFKKANLEVFLVKMDNNKSAIMSRKGIQPTMFVGAAVSITNTGCRYWSKDFKTRAGYNDLTFTDDVKQGQKGVLLRVTPHFKLARTLCHVIALDAGPTCAVMNAKGIVPAEVAGLAEATSAAKQKREEREKEAKEAELKRKADGEAGSPAKVARKEEASKAESPQPRTGDAEGAAETPTVSNSPDKAANSPEQGGEKEEKKEEVAAEEAKDGEEKADK